MSNLIETPIGDPSKNIVNNNVDNELKLPRRRRGLFYYVRNKKI